MRKLSFRSTETFSVSQTPDKLADADGSLPDLGNRGDHIEEESKKMLKMMEIGDTQHHFTRNGHLVANKQLIYKVDSKEGVQSVSIYSPFVKSSFSKTFF